MSGFQVWNEAGALTIDSDNRHTIVTAQSTPGLTDVGVYGGATPFGDWKELGYLTPSAMPVQNNLYWIRLNTNAWCFPGAWMFKPGTFQIITTSRTQALTSGILDVYNSAGGLIWSAVSAQNMPRTRQIISITSAADNAVASVTPGFSPWFLMGACPGNYSFDGETTGYSGLIFRWTGTQLQYAWVRNNQKTFAETFGGRGGLRIPLAEFPGR